MFKCLHTRSCYADQRAAFSVSSLLNAADLTNPKTNWNKTPGYTEAETSSFARILNTAGADNEDADAPRFVDAWRKLHPDLRHYTYFSYRFNCREKGIGWRLDTCAYLFLVFLLFTARRASRLSLGPRGR